MNTPLPVRLTPSMLTFLWEECRRCFWLHAHGLARPRLPFPAVFSRYHDVLSRFFLGRCPSTLDASLPPGRFLGGELWVESRPLRAGRFPYFIRGRLDHLAQFDDGTWGLIDFKMLAPHGEHLDKYARQLHAYVRALEMAAPTGLNRAPITRMGLFCIDPVQVEAHTAGDRLLVRLQPVWIEIRRDDATFDAFLEAVLEVIARPLPPKAAPDCPCCTYSNRRRALARRMSHAQHHQP